MTVSAASSYLLYLFLQLAINPVLLVLVLRIGIACLVALAPVYIVASVSLSAR